MNAEEARARAYLGVGLHAPSGDIDRRFRLLVRSAHPDSGGSAEQFRQLTDAYAVVLGARRHPTPRHAGSTGQVETHVTSLRGRWRRLVVSTRALARSRGGFS